MGYYLAIKRNETDSSVEIWMNLKSATQSEVNHKEKNKYHILTHVCGILRLDVYDEFGYFQSVISENCVHYYICGKEDVSLVRRLLRNHKCVSTRCINRQTSERSVSNGPLWIYSSPVHSLNIEF